MNNKKQQILNNALELFAADSYTATSTSKIAKAAGVSEGLIFRHFKNKKGLLDALVTRAEAKLGALLTDIISETEPKTIIKKTIELPFTVNEEDFDFWRLQFKLKWEQNYNSPDKMKPLLDKLTSAFIDLGYKEAVKEAYLLNRIIESLSIAILRDGIARQETFKQFLLEKYEV